MAQLSVNVSPVMNFDDILLELGEFGPWQRNNNLLLWLPSASAGASFLIAAFAVLGPRNGYRCRQRESSTPALRFRSCYASSLIL